MEYHASYWDGQGWRWIYEAGLPVQIKNLPPINFKPGEVGEYKMVTGFHQGAIVEAVNKAVGEGWQPFGGPALAPNGVFNQVVVKYK